jgi:hypothetical protein
MKKAFFSSKILASIVVLGLAACTPELDMPEPQQGSADFSKTLAIGGGFLSGYQDGALNDDGQNKSLPALLARQFSYANARGGIFYQTAIQSPEGFGWNLKSWESYFVHASKLRDRTDCEGTVSLGPVKDSLPILFATPFLSNSYNSQNQNFGIPYARTSDLVSPAFGNAPLQNNTNPYYHRMASAPGTSTVLGDAVNANASFFTAWLGMEDIFDYARRGGEGAGILSPASFEILVDSVFSQLTANGAKGVVANIPDFRSFPYYTLIPYNGATLTASKADSLNDIYDVSNLSHIRFYEGANGFVINDVNAPQGVRQIHAGEYLTLGLPLDSVKCQFMGILFSTIPDRYVIDSSEAAILDQHIAAYNQIIAQKASEYNLAFVDMYAYFARLTSGVQWDGVTTNAVFVSGGFFSLDGYHPHQKGYALLANEFIFAINAKYGATIPTLNCFDCNGVLFP